MAVFKNITNVSMTGATTAISQYTQVLRISGSNGSGNTFTLPQVTAVDSSIGYDYEIIVVDSQSYFTNSSVATFEVNGSDTGYTINGASSWSNDNNNEAFFIRYAGEGRWYTVTTGFKEGEIINFSSGGVLTSITDKVANADDATYLTSISGQSLTLHNSTQSGSNPGGYFAQLRTSSPEPKAQQLVDGVIYYSVGFEASTSGVDFDIPLPRAGTSSYTGVEVSYVASDGTILSSGGECEVGEWNTSVLDSTAVLEDFYYYRDAQDSSGRVAFLVDWSGSISGTTLTLTCTSASGTPKVTAHFRLYTISYA